MYRRTLINLNRKKNRILRNILSKKNVDIGKNTVSLEDDRNHVFFGYYDVTPFHPDKDILLAMKVPYKRQINVRNTEIKLGFFNLSDKTFHKFGSSASWCWQQGCRMQWFINTAPFAVLHNGFEHGEYFSQVLDIFSGDILTRFSKPIYSISPDYKWGISLDFSRLQRLRPGYGYSNLGDTTVGQENPQDNGIWRVDLSSGKSDLIFSIREIANLNNNSLKLEGEHYFNHLLFHPKKYDFLFFHIIQSKSDRLIRLYKTDIELSKIEIIVDINYKISHFNWFSDYELITYLGAGPDGKGYYLVHIENKTVTKIKRMPHELDGHPSLSTAKNYIITDSVVNKYSERELYHYDLSKQNSTLIGEFYNPFRYYAEIRCDLHPRIDSKNNRVCVDSAHSGKRGMYILNFD